MAPATSRTLGKGRTLGSGKPLPQPQPQQHTLSAAVRAPPLKNQQGLLSPSESSQSLNSQQSTAQSSNDDTDIRTAVAAQARTDVESGAAGSRMVCPICNEEMMTLLQLNRHIDDTHNNLEDEEQDEVKDWFKAQIVKAKKFQPLAVLNQKFKGLDVFEPNEDRRTPTPSHNYVHPPPAQIAGRASPDPQRPLDPDDLITKEHWQRYSPGMSCSDPLCEKRLGGLTGSINCRKCGRLFCEEHTMYQMKLSRSAAHEPVRGHWYRVCETCYKSREGYNDHNGVTRDHFEAFSQHRRKNVDKAALEVSRLEKRLTRLTQALANPEVRHGATSTIGYLRGLSGGKSAARLAEESIVDWEDDSTVSNCPFCRQEFSAYTFRRHHCRLCGRVVCNDPDTQCSSEIPLKVATTLHRPPEKEKEQHFNTTSQDQDPPSTIPLTIRLCQTCNRTLFSARDFAASLSTPHLAQRTFQHLKSFEHGIALTLPRFQKLLSALQDPARPPSEDQLSAAQKTRRRLTEAFTQYELAARRIRDLPSPPGSAEARLQKAVYARSSQFLHSHMLPLKALPKLLRRANGAAASPDGSAPHSRNTSTSSLPLPPDTADAAAATKRQRLDELEQREKEAREQLIVLEEQRFMVRSMLADAQRRRKFEEVKSLSGNLEDLEGEAGRLNGVVEGVGGEVRGLWEGR